MMSGFVPFCAFAGRRYPAISKKVNTIEANAPRHNERNKRDIMTPFVTRNFFGEMGERLTTKQSGVNGGDFRLARGLNFGRNKGA